MAGAEEVRKLSQFGFWEERSRKTTTTTKKTRDNVLVRGGCEDALGIAIMLGSRSATLSTKRAAAHIMHCLSLEL